MARTPLHEAIIWVCADLTVDDLAEAIGVPRSTAGRWLKSLREPGGLEAWSAVAVERLAAHERKALGSQAIAEALGAAAVSSSGEPSARALRRQMDQTDRKASSLKLQLDDIEAHVDLDRDRTRQILQRTEAVLREGAAQQHLLQRWRTALLRRMRGS